MKFLCEVLFRFLPLPLSSFKMVSVKRRKIFIRLGRRWSPWMNADWYPQRFVRYAGCFLWACCIWLVCSMFRSLVMVQGLLPIDWPPLDSPWFCRSLWVAVKCSKVFPDQAIHHTACGLTLPPARTLWPSIQSVDTCTYDCFFLSFFFF